MPQIIQNYAILFRNRHYMRFYAGDSLKLLATVMLKYGCLWYVWNATKSSLAIGALVAAELTPTLVLSFIGGILADGQDRFKLVRRYQGYIAALTLGVAFIVASAAHLPFAWTIGLLIGIYAIIGVCTALLVPCSFTITTSVVDHSVLSKAVSANSLNANFASLIAPMLTYALVETVGYSSVFVVASLFMAFYVYNMGHIKKRPDYADPYLGAKVRELPREIADMFRKAPNVDLLYGVLLWTAILVRPVIEQYPALINAPAGGARFGQVGLFAVIIGCGNLLGSLIQSSSAKDIHIGNLMRHVVICAGAILCIVLVRSVVGAAIGLFVLAASFAICRIIILYLLQISVPEKYRGRMLSIYFAMITGVAGLGVLAAGAMGRAQLGYYGVGAVLSILFVAGRAWHLSRQAAVSN